MEIFLLVFGVIWLFRWLFDSKMAKQRQEEGYIYLPNPNGNPGCSCLPIIVGLIVGVIILIAVMGYTEQQLIVIFGL